MFIEKNIRLKKKTIFFYWWICLEKEELMEKSKAAYLEQVEEQIAKAVRKGKRRKDIRDFAIFSALLATAVLGRVALQFVPSIEPIIPFAIIAGFLFGIKEGFLLGATAYTASNFFVWGLQGPWTIFQALGAGIAGGLAGFAGKGKKTNWKDIVIWSVIGTLVFEFLMNISGALLGIALFPGVGLLLIPLYFLTALPFSAAHIAANIGFARLLSPLLKLRRENEFKAISITHSDTNGNNTTVRLLKSE